MVAPVASGRVGTEDLVDDRRTIKNWASRLSAPDESLTLEEARTLAAIAGADRQLEVRDILQDIQSRLTRMELYLAENVPGYDEQTRRLAMALAERTDGSVT